MINGHDNHYDDDDDDNQTMDHAPVPTNHSWTQNDEHDTAIRMTMMMDINSGIDHHKHNGNIK